MILRFLMDNFRIVRLGTTRSGRKLFFQLQKERERLLAAGYQASTLKIAENLDVPESEVILMDQQMRAPAMSLHGEVGEGDGRMLEELVASEVQLSTDDEAAENQMGQVIQTELNAFRAGLDDKREQAIWDDRLTSHDPLSLSQLGKRFGISKERVRQLEARMREELKEQLQRNLGDEIDFSFRMPGEDR
jgi:RNA polymerase sigma-32 factor